MSNENWNLFGSEVSKIAGKGNWSTEVYAIECQSEFKVDSHSKSERKYTDSLFGQWIDWTFVNLNLNAEIKQRLWWSQKILNTYFEIKNLYFSKSFRINYY